LAFATAGDAGLASPLAAEIEPNDLICLGSVTVDGAAGDVDKTALLSSMDPNCTLLAFAGIGAATNNNDRQRGCMAKWKNAGYKVELAGSLSNGGRPPQGLYAPPKEKKQDIEPDRV
jgi:hypothetical protein